MKKSLACMLSLGLLSGSALGEGISQQTNSDLGKMFIGAELYQGETTIETDFSGSASGSFEEDVDISGFRARFGKVMENDFRFQAYFFSEKPDDGNVWSNNIFGFGADAVKPFPVHETFQPFVKAGALVGWTEMDDTPDIDYVDDRLNSIGLKLGLGGLAKINKSIELMGGFDWQYRTWQDIKYIGAGQTITQETSDISTSLYIGLNFFL